jgi:predicted HAD superfamily Cof-like phosphohydrolase
MMDWYADVCEFHNAMDCERRALPTPISDKSIDFRLDLMEEELAETEQAMFADDLPAIADGLADLIYVAIGTAVAYGIDLRPVWAAVQAANLGKLGGTVREDGKRMKPPGWKPPDVAAILAGQSPIMEIDQS